MRGRHRGGGLHSRNHLAPFIVGVHDRGGQSDFCHEFFGVGRIVGPGWRAGSLAMTLDVGPISGRLIVHHIVLCRVPRGRSRVIGTAPIGIGLRCARIQARPTIAGLAEMAGARVTRVRSALAFVDRDRFAVASRRRGRVERGLPR